MRKSEFPIIIFLGFHSLFSDLLIGVGFVAGVAFTTQFRIFDLVDFCFF